MDKYHIYDQIGKGNFSQVFKGREKKRIEYVAIKRIDKSMMNKIVHEVQILHKLESPHCLKFHDWYETRNNLWLILEYCTGADLEKLLIQDGHLPEDSVRIFGLDILAGLKYLHSEGLLHCDLRPRNFLVDEYGIIKMCDFKLSRKIPKNVLGDIAYETRGIAEYMAPELFSTKGVHSFASDFWALGCMLYELRRGILPFGSLSNSSDNQHNGVERWQSTTEKEINIFLDRLHNTSPVTDPSPACFKSKGKTRKTIATVPPMSAELADLMTWLLEKHVEDRCGWDELFSHPFWALSATEIQQQKPQVQMPQQPIYDLILREKEQRKNNLLLHEMYSEYGLSGEVTEKELAGILEAVSLGVEAEEEEPENREVNNQHEVKNVHSALDSKGNAGRSSNTRASKDGSKSSTKSKSEASSRKGQRSPTSRANSGTAKEKDTSARNPSSNQAPDKASREYVRKEGTEINQFNTTSGNKTATPSPAHGATRTGKNKGQTSSKSTMNTPSMDPPFNVNKNDKRRTDGGTPTTEIDNVGALDAERVLAIGPLGLGAVLDSGAEYCYPPNSLIVHLSDTTVKPIVGNKAIEVLERPIFKASGLPVSAISPDDASSLAQSQLQQHLTVLYKYLHRSTTSSSNTSISDRNNVLSYLYSLASSVEVANIVLNTHFLGLLLRFIRAAAPNTGARTTRTGTSDGRSSGLSLRALASTVLSTMLRYCTAINPPTATNKDEHIIPVLLSVLKETNRQDPYLRRRALAGLGELLFYLSSNESTENGEGAISEWGVTTSSLAMIVKCLRDDGDEITRHYAAKTIENIMTTGSSEFRRKFTTLEIAERLMEMSLHGRNESLQSSCAMAAFHLFMRAILSDPTTRTNAINTRETDSPSKGRQSKRGNPISSRSASPRLSKASISDGPGAGARFLVRVLERGGMNGILETLHDGPGRLQQAYLNILNLIFSSELKTTSGKDGAVLDPSTAVEERVAVDAALRSTRQFFMGASTLLPALVRLIEQGSSAPIRSKALLTLQLMSTHHRPILAVLAERRLPIVVTRILKSIPAREVNPDDKEEGKLATPPYVCRSALSFLALIRRELNVSSRLLSDQLTELHVNQVGSLDINGQGTPLSPRSPEDHLRSRPMNLTTPNSTSTPDVRIGTPAPGSSHKDQGSVDGAVTSVSMATMAEAVCEASQSLRAALSMCVIPGLKRLLIGSKFLINLARTADVLSRCLKVPSMLEHPLVAEAVKQGQEAVVMAIESVTQIDVEGVHYVLHEQHHLPSASILQEANDLLNALMHNFLPHLCLLSNAKEKDGNDMEIVIASCVRSILPSLFRAFIAENKARIKMNNQEISESDSAMTRGFSESVKRSGLSVIHILPNLLRCNPPVPQYVSKTLAEIVSLGDEPTLWLLENLKNQQPRSTSGEVSTLNLLIAQLLDDANSVYPVPETLHVLKAFIECADSSEGTRGPSIVISKDFSSHTLSLLKQAVGRKDVTLIFAAMELIFTAFTHLMSGMASTHLPSNTNGRQPTSPTGCRWTVSEATESRRALSPLLQAVPLLFNILDSELTSHMDLHEDMCSMLADISCSVLSLMFDLSPVEICGYFFGSKTVDIAVAVTVRLLDPKVEKTLLTTTRVRYMKLLIVVFETMYAKNSDDLLCKKFINRSTVRHVLEVLQNVTATSTTGESAMAKYAKKLVALG